MINGCFYYNKEERTLKEVNFSADEQFFGYCVLRDFDRIYKEDFQRFKKEPKIYALPNKQAPSRVYNGLSRFGLLKERPPKKVNKELKREYNIYNKSVTLLPTEKDAEIYTCLHTNKSYYSISFIRMLGCKKNTPSGYRFIGYDVVYPPSCDGAFSLIFDCFFICKRYGCDSNGTEFMVDFKRLNENGLFDKSEDAFEFMKHYFSFGWTKNAYCYIYEIYEKE